LIKIEQYQELNDQFEQKVEMLEKKNEEIQAKNDELEIVGESLKDEIKKLQAKVESLTAPKEVSPVQEPAISTSLKTSKDMDTQTDPPVISAAPKQITTTSSPPLPKTDPPANNRPVSNKEKEHLQWSSKKSPSFEGGEVQKRRFYKKELMEFKELPDQNRLLPTIQLFESKQLPASTKPPALPSMNSDKMKSLIKNFEVKTLRNPDRGRKRESVNTKL